jgi:hypothetical protein
MSIVDLRPRPTRQYPPLFMDTETFIPMRTPNGLVVKEIQCHFTKGITCDRRPGMEGCWTLRGCDTISARCSYKLSPMTDLGQLYVDYREGVNGGAVQRKVHTIALVPRAENVGSKHAGLYHLGRKNGRQAWLPIQAQALSPRESFKRSPALGPSDIVQPTTVNPTAAAKKYVCHFQDMHVRDRPQTSKRRAYQQYLHVTLEMYADVRADGSDAPEWVKVAQRRSNPIIMFGKVGGKTEFPLRLGRREKPAAKSLQDASATGGGVLDSTAGSM